MGALSCRTSGGFVIFIPYTKVVPVGWESPGSRDLSSELQRRASRRLPPVRQRQQILHRQGDRATSPVFSHVKYRVCSCCLWPWLPPSPALWGRCAGRFEGPSAAAGRAVPVGRCQSAHCPGALGSSCQLSRYRPFGQRAPDLGRAVPFQEKISPGRHRGTGRCQL